MPSPEPDTAPETTPPTGAAMGLRKMGPVTIQSGKGRGPERPSSPWGTSDCRWRKERERSLSSAILFACSLDDLVQLGESEAKKSLT